MIQQLTNEEIQDLKNKGYTQEEINFALSEANNAHKSNLQQSYNAAQKQQQNSPYASASNSYVSGGQNDNLIQWQLELDSILERIEHMLRGDKITFVKGSIIWVPPKDKKDEVFNDNGVSETMRLLSNYVNRNTVLSNYDEPTINEKMLDLGYELSDLYYLKYEMFGLDTLEKRKIYPMIVRQIVDIVHSAYLRSLNGGERESLREARQVNQTDAIAPMAMIPGRERGLLNPLRLFGGKYK